LIYPWRNPFPNVKINALRAIYKGTLVVVLRDSGYIISLLI
jgi:hypothetical protein